jgi:hypothetical protein
LLHTAAAAVRVLLGAALALGLARQVRADDLATALYIRQDSDRTTVISPHARLGKVVQEGTQVSATYAADVWTSASVDIQASASKRPVTEQRDELQLGVQQEWMDLHMQAGYRFSSEPDYTSHGLSISGSYDLAGNASTLSAALHVFADAVGRSGDPKFSRQQGTYDASLSFTQIIDPMMFVSATYELAHLRGYQASPYRFVGIGPEATGFGCLGTSECFAERVPRARTRHAFAVLARRAFGEVFSLGLNYRFYIDDWSLSSHTLLAELGWNLGARSLLSLRYRFYTQTHADFYRKRYAELLSSGYRTRDKELSPMNYHRAGLEFEQIAWSSEEGRKLRASLAVSGNFYAYDDFVGLDAVRALEVTAAVLLEL